MVKRGSLCLVCGSLLIACAPPPHVEVVERNIIDPRLATEKIGGSHVRIAQPGDSLYGIAFENGLNPNSLAAWNGLSDTARLQIGQKLRLTKPIGFARTKSARPQVNAVAKPKTAKKPPITTGSRVVGVVKITPQVPPKTSIDWRWPTKGVVVKKFALASGQQGIDIGGESGQAVLASSAGEVVYVGNGLKGYGNLVIIKHSEHFLSAYARNRETFVQEGQKVNAGYRIATLGTDKLQRNALHFQIRKNGEPVNPLLYLKIK